MSFTLRTSTDIVNLPSPDVDNGEWVQADVNLRWSMDSTPYTYVRQSGLRKMNYTWSDLGRGKIAQFEEFLAANYGNEITITDHRGVGYRVYVEDTTMSFQTNKLTTTSGGPRKESGSTTLTFIGTRS